MGFPSHEIFHAVVAAVYDRGMAVEHGVSLAAKVGPAHDVEANRPAKP